MYNDQVIRLSEPVRGPVLEVTRNKLKQSPVLVSTLIDCLLCGTLYRFFKALISEPSVGPVYLMLLKYRFFEVVKF